MKILKRLLFASVCTLACLIIALNRSRLEPVHAQAEGFGFIIHAWLDEDNYGGVLGDSYMAQFYQYYYDVDYYYLEGTMTRNGNNVGTGGGSHGNAYTSAQTSYYVPNAPGGSYGWKVKGYACYGYGGSYFGDGNSCSINYVGEDEAASIFVDYPPPPQIDSISPDYAATGATGTLTLAGRDFIQSSQDHLSITFSGGGNHFTLPSNISQCSTQCTVTVSYDLTGVPSGYYTLHVTNDEADSDNVSFHVKNSTSSNSCNVHSDPSKGSTSIILNGGINLGVSGTFSVSFGGSSFAGINPQVTYGPYSTPESIASSMAALISRNYFGYGLTARAFGANIIYSGIPTSGTGGVTLGLVSPVFSGASFAHNPDPTAASYAEAACASAPADPVATSSGSSLNPCSGANPSNLDYSQMYYNGGTQSVKNHIIEKHILPSPGDSRYDSSFNSGPLNVFDDIVRYHNEKTLQYGILVGSGGTTYILQYTYPSLSILGVQFRGIGYGKTGGVVRTNKLLVQSNCSTVITSFPIEP